jgi:peptide/nickel transport system substrate-binding protein
LRFGQAEADLGTADPHFAAATQDRALVDMIFNGLVRYKPGDGSVVEPDLAVELPRPVVVGGKQVWTFRLRRGVMFHPSERVPAYELTSEDVVYSLEKSADKARSAYSAQYGGLTFHAVDRYTVGVTLDTAVSANLFHPLVANYAGGFIVSKRAVETYGLDGVKTRPVGTGPFLLRRYSPKEKVELGANPQYFRGRPLLAGIDYRYIADPLSRELGLRSGQLDAINGRQDEAWITKMQGVPNTHVDVFGVGESTILYFNQMVRPLDRKEVRQAIAFALNRDDFLALVGKKAAQRLLAPLAPFTSGALTESDVVSKNLEYKYNLDQARHLLAEAGIAGGLKFEMVTSELPSYRIPYESLQAQLAKVGISIRLRVVDHASYHALIRKDTNPMVVYVAFRPNADIYLRSFYHSAAVVVTGPRPDTNFIHYAAIDGIIDRARVDTNPSSQVATWKDAQVKILQDMVAYPILIQNQVYARSAAVDYGHPLKSVLALYPGIDETTRLG